MENSSGGVEHSCGDCPVDGLRWEPGELQTDRYCNEEREVSALDSPVGCLEYHN